MCFILTFFSFLKFLADTCPFLGPLVPLFWISDEVSSGFQSQSGLPYLHYGGEHNVRFPKSTSGATLADLLVGGAQPVLSPHTVAEVRLPFILTSIYDQRLCTIQHFNVFIISSRELSDD